MAEPTKRRGHGATIRSEGEGHRRPPHLGARGGQAGEAVLGHGAFRGHCRAQAGREPGLGGAGVEAHQRLGVG
eukprot:9160722-Lingulodinium_polyedra.AAC.1